MAKGARGLTWFWSNNCLVLPELEVNQLSSKTAEAAVNATNLTNPVVTLEAEVANPWRAGCLETCTSGSEGGVRKRAEEQRALPLPYSGENLGCTETLSQDLARGDSQCMEYLFPRGVPSRIRAVHGREWLGLTCLPRAR
jgi:hypothetical protein